MVIKRLTFKSYGEALTFYCVQSRRDNVSCSLPDWYESEQKWIVRLSTED